MQSMRYHNVTVSAHYRVVGAGKRLRTIVSCKGILAFRSETLVAICSPDGLYQECTPSRLPRKCRLTLILLYLMSKAFELLSLCLLPKRIDFVFSSPKCMLSLISRNHLRSELKSLFSCSSIVHENKTSIICIKKKLTVHSSQFTAHSLWHVAYVQQEKKRT